MDIEAANNIGKAILEKNSNKWDKTTHFLRTSLQEKKKKVEELIKKIDGKPLDIEAETGKMNKRIEFYDNANETVTEIFKARPKTRVQLRNILKQGAKETLKAIRSCLFEEKFEDPNDTKINKNQLLNVITDEIVARGYKHCTWCMTTTCADENESGYKALSESHIKCEICSDYICNKCSTGEKEKIREIRDLKMVTISCGTCKEGINSIAKYMLESDTASTEVYPDAFKEIKKYREGESLNPYKY